MISTSFARIRDLYFNPTGNLISVTDPADNTTKFAYEAFGELISMTDPNGGGTKLAYLAVPEPST
jgi:YD repeat-containing protein